MIPVSMGFTRLKDNSTHSLLDRINCRVCDRGFPVSEPCFSLIGIETRMHAGKIFEFLMS
jgi:hypothetical protein